MRGGRGGTGGRRGVVRDSIPRPSLISTGSNRDSDVSFTSNTANNRGSNASIGRNSTVAVNDRSYQTHAIRVINSYLSSHSTSFLLKPPLPSAKDITDTIKFLFTHLDYLSASDSSSSQSFKIEEDFPLLLKNLNCPIKLNKSALKAPGTPHAWPSLLSVIHWLVQICLYNDHISSTSSTTRSSLQNNKFLAYALDSYAEYIRGDDDAVDALDKEFNEVMGRERDSAANRVKSLEEEVQDLEKQVESLRSAPSAREASENEKSVLEEDVKKFHVIVDGYKSGIVTLEKGLEEKEKQLETKYQENRMICEENQELKKSIEAQTVNMRDAERMKRELQAVEREISEAEVSRNAWEEKSWDIAANVSHKFKELENLSVECNQAIRRLKLGNDLQYVLNANGSTAAKVLGIDYKSTLKVALNALAEDIKKSSVGKLEELISLRQQSRENATKLDAKRKRLAELQSKIDAGEAQLSSMKNETEDFISKCAAEAKRMMDNVERERHNLETMEREAEEFVKVSKAKLEDTTKQSEEAIQVCARELLGLVDSVSRYKEYMESTIAEMKTDLSVTAENVANAYRGSVPPEFVNFTVSQ